MLALVNLEALTLLLYFYRDAAAGGLRYYLDIVHLGAFWFVPDLFALLCVGLFFYRSVIVGGNRIAKVLFCCMGFSLVIGYFFLQSGTAVASSIKMISPVFLGFCFLGRDIRSYRLTLAAIHLLFYLSTLAVIVSKYVDLPWIGYSYEAFGAVRQAGRLWWSGGDQRLAGFAADSTMAAFFVLLTFVFTSIRRSTAWCVLWGGVGIYSIELTTNKTSLAVFIIYLIGLLFVRLFRAPANLEVLRRLALGSFGCILIPPFLMIVLSGTNLASMNEQLFSLEDRINNSWQNPFIYMAELMPTGYLTGCGLGCFNYPQQLFAPSLAGYFVPVDNFYIGTFLMFGLPFAVFMFYVIQAVRTTDDPYKLSFVFVMNVFTVTVLSYGPASGLLIIGMAFSEVFVNRSPRPVAASRGLASRRRLQLSGSR